MLVSCELQAGLWGAQQQTWAPVQPLRLETLDDFGQTPGVRRTLAQSFAMAPLSALSHYHPPSPTSAVRLLEESRVQTLGTELGRDSHPHRDPETPIELSRAPGQGLSIRTSSHTPLWILSSNFVTFKIQDRVSEPL